MGAVAAVVCGCSTQTSVEPGIQTNEPTRKTVGIIHNCEPGQMATDKGCSDVVVTQPGGESVNLREATLNDACSRSWAKVQAAIRERRAFTAKKGESLKIGLQIVDAECAAREQHLAICERSGYFEATAGNRAFHVRCRDGLFACRRLGNLYRDMIAGGLRVTP